MSDDPQSDALTEKVERLDSFWFGPPDDPDDVPRSVHIVRMIRRDKFWRDARRFLLLASGVAGALVAFPAAVRTIMEMF